MREDFGRPDIVVVGGGSAGCVLASRLSENPDLKVLLLEAGPDFGVEEPADIVHAFPRAYANPAYFTARMAASVRDAEDSRPYTQARVLGGGSSVMGMWALRGLAEDFDAWPSLGAPGWAHAEILRFFRRLETDADFDGERHGRDGPIGIRRIPRSDWPAFASAMEKAAGARGYRSGVDMNGDDRDGFFPLPINADGAGRASATRYLTAAVRRRANLRIRGDAEVARIVVKNRRATAVEIQVGGAVHHVEAGAVILAAGAIHSPALLMRSGIGPAGRLAACGLDVVHDLPGIGSNLQNHTFLHIAAFVRRNHRQDTRLENYITSAFRFSSGLPGAPASDMLLGMIARPGIHTGGNAVALLGVHLYAPFSRGEVGLHRTGEGLETTIDFRLLSDPRDAERLVGAARFAAGLLADPIVKDVVDDPFLVPATAPIRALNAPGMASRLRTLGLGVLSELPGPVRRGFTRAVLPGARFLDEIDEDAFAAAALDCVLPMFHVAGTCAIGRVVRPDLSLIGIDGLFVADASVMPVVPRANTNLATIMVAERAAELIAAKCVSRRL